MKPLLLVVTAALLAVATARAVEYKVDGSLGKGQFKQLAIKAGDQLCALNAAGDIEIFNADGSAASTIRTGLQQAEALAVAPDGSILVFCNITESKKVKSGARMVTVEVPIGVEYTVFDAAGQKQDSKRLTFLKSVKKAGYVDGRLVVADLSARAVVIIDPETGTEIGRITEGLRLCCGIFDFCEAPEGTLAVSNLGAFKLQQFSLDGKLVMEFGKRGRELNEFHGCCNPVSAAYLPGSEILTVEKDPTRIKIYDAQGKSARQIDGVDELVKGCSYIPVAVDSKGTVYLAAATKNCIVRCTVK